MKVYVCRQQCHLEICEGILAPWQYMKTGMLQLCPQIIPNIFTQHSVPTHPKTLNMILSFEYRAKCNKACVPIYDRYKLLINWIGLLSKKNHTMPTTPARDCSIYQILHPSHSPRSVQRLFRCRIFLPLLRCWWRLPSRCRNDWSWSTLLPVSKGSNQQLVWNLKIKQLSQKSKKKRSGPHPGCPLSQRRGQGQRFLLCTPSCWDPCLWQNLIWKSIWWECFMEFNMVGMVYMYKSIWWKFYMDIKGSVKKNR